MSAHDAPVTLPLILWNLTSDPLNICCDDPLIVCSDDPLKVCCEIFLFILIWDLCCKVPCKQTFVVLQPAIKIITKWYRRCLSAGYAGNCWVWLFLIACCWDHYDGLYHTEAGFNICHVQLICMLDNCTYDLCITASFWPPVLTNRVPLWYCNDFFVVTFFTSFSGITWSPLTNIKLVSTCTFKQNTEVIYP